MGKLRPAPGRTAKLRRDIANQAGGRTNVSRPAQAAPRPHVFETPPAMRLATRVDKMSVGYRSGNVPPDVREGVSVKFNYLDEEGKAMEVSCMVGMTEAERQTLLKPLDAGWNGSVLDEWLELSDVHGNAVMRLPLVDTTRKGPAPTARPGKLPSVAEFYHQSRPLVLASDARKLPKPLGTSLSEALEAKYEIARWCGTEEAKWVFEEMAKLTTPEHPFGDPGQDNVAAGGVMRNALQENCIYSTLHYCTPEITRSLKQGADVLPDFTLTDDMIPDDSGLFIWFGEGMRVLAPAAPRTTDVGVHDPARPMDIVGIAVSPIWVGTSDPLAPAGTTVDLLYTKRKQFVASVKQWHRQVFIQPLMSAPGGRKVIPISVVTWDIGTTYREQLATYNYVASNNVEAWRAEDDLTARLLGTFCLFIQQTIMQFGTGRADRATRRRLEGAHIGKRLLPPDPPIRVIQLRRKEYIVPAREDDKEAVDWQCRWVVAPHWQKVWCGPGRQELQHRWIAAYIKGPDGKPLKAPSARVFAVTR